MFVLTRILAAVDFSEPSRVALRMAARLARHCRAELHVLHVEHPLLSAAAQSAGMNLTSETREQLSAFMVTAEPAGGRLALHHATTGPAVDTICAVADREHADVIVMGAHGMSPFRRMLFGSTTEGVLRRASVSVLAVPDSWTPPEPDSSDLRGIGPIVAAYDFSAASRAAAVAACDLAATLQAEVELVHIAPPLVTLPRWAAHAEVVLQQHLDLARRDLAALAGELPPTARIRVRIESGSVHQRLAEVATRADRRHPLLVLGRRSRTEQGDAPGATAYRTLCLAQVPVLIHLPAIDSSGPPILAAHE